MPPTLKKINVSFVNNSNSRKSVHPEAPIPKCRRWQQDYRTMSIIFNWTMQRI
jgi:hypothetical protein